MKKTILIIEDDRSINEGIKLSLGLSDYNYLQGYNYEEGYNLLKAQEYDLVILDLNLPGGNGLDLLEYVKTLAKTIILTANDLEVDIVAGLERGADDYMTKPFSLMVLRARVRAQLRDLTSTVQSDNIIIIDDFCFDFDGLKFTINNNSIELSKTEIKLLKLLVNNQGIVLKRTKLIDEIWDEQTEFVDENALSVTMKRLRDKLENKQNKDKYIKTIYGIGYKWEK